MRGIYLRSLLLLAGLVALLAIEAFVSPPAGSATAVRAGAVGAAHGQR